MADGESDAGEWETKDGTLFSAWVDEFDGKARMVAQFGVEAMNTEGKVAYRIRKIAPEEDSESGKWRTVALRHPKDEKDEDSSTPDDPSEQWPRFAAETPLNAGKYTVELRVETVNSNREQFGPLTLIIHE